MVMRTCPKCGSYLPENAILCPSCNRLCINVGKNVQDATKSETKRRKRRLSEAQKEAQRDDWTVFSQEYSDTYNEYEQHTSHMPGSDEYYSANPHASTEAGPYSYDRQEPRNDGQQTGREKTLSAIGYFGFFFFLPLVLCPKSEFARFHANQALVLFLLKIALGIATNLLGMYMGYGLFSLANIATTALIAYGAVTAAGGKMTPMPLVGGLQLIKTKNG